MALQKLRQIRRPHPRQQAEIKGLAEDAVPVLRHRRRQIANPAIVQSDVPLPPR